MTIKQKNKSRILPVTLFLAVVTVLAVVLAPRFLHQSTVIQSLQNSVKDKQIAELLVTMSKNPNKESQEYKELRQKFCLLTARSVKEREKAIANIREFLGMPDLPVEFLCSRFAGKPDDSGTDYNNPASEYYEAALFSFEIDPKNNYIIAVGEAERRWGTKEDGTRWFENMPEYDYSGRYSKPEEVKKIAEKFLTDHKDILGIDITKMTYEFEGTKPGNFFLKWRTVDGRGKTIELVNVTITNGGQVIVYDNDTYDLAKNGR